MTTDIDMGQGTGGASVPIDLEELLASRLLVQGNSGSGKSHLLRRLLEQSAGLVQQVVIDPEGDFVSLAERFGHLVIEAADYTEAETGSIAARVREHRVSVVLNLEGLEVDAQLRCAGSFLNRLFDAPRDQWYPVLVVVDEAQLFAPAAAGEVGEEARRASLGAMTNLMCRGRKRGLAGVIATQRLAKLAKNVAAEASNFLMGRTFLDIDMARAADLLGMERRQAEQIRDLERGQFLALGPAIARRPQLIRIGAVQTGGRGAAPGLAPLPSHGDAQALLFERLEDTPPPPPAAPPVEPVEHLLARIDEADPDAAQTAPELDASDPAPVIDAVLRDIVADEDAAHRAPGALYQDFALRCRMRGLARPPLQPVDFARRLTLARAGLFSDDLADQDWAAALRIADTVPEDMLGVFMLIARAARAGAPCPTEAEIARVYGTHSIGRARRLLGYMESKNYLALRVDLRGRRTAAIPSLGWATAPEETAAA
ncbi:MAG TPA: ATP-binding protein [Sphingomonas sp.]|uniref:ATP-binding protein n=1 Tax=Sphingomonas sp. TaxID=28214 RepID=UPI002C459A83|nr:ATP-binding protein [Sphingomonas sp.]HMI18445.1 ATP-binding protein [Sphingomonas sp.]